jgi:hypothetical protein
MPNGVLGLSTALKGLFSYLPPWVGFTLSSLFLLREKVEMERAGREAGGPAVVAFFSGENESARVAEGVLLCEDWVPVEEVLVRSEALRERRSVEPMSATDEEMLCREACRRRGGVAGTFGGEWCGSCDSPAGAMDG